MVIYLQRSPSRLKDEIWEPAVAFSCETNKQDQGGTKGGTKLKRNSVEARRKAQCGHAATDRTAILARRDKDSWMFILIYALRETADK